MQNSALNFYCALCFLLCSLLITALARPDPVCAQNAVAGTSPEAPPLSQISPVTNSGDKKNPLSEAVEAVSDQDPLALALKNIELTMGENGFEVWRLKAKWASMRENDGSIEVLQPQIVYSMGDNHSSNSTSKTTTADKSAPVADASAEVDPAVPGAASLGTAASNQTNASAGAPHAKLPQAPDMNDDSVILVTADKGIVRQKDKLIILEGDVNAVRGASHLSGPRMVYDGQSRIITFTDGMRFNGEGVTGQAVRGNWSLKDNIINADGGVNLIYQAPMPAAPSRTGKTGEHPETAVPRNEDNDAGQKTVSKVTDPGVKKPAQAKTKTAPAEKNVTSGKKKTRDSSTPTS